MKLKVLTFAVIVIAVSLRAQQQTQITGLFDTGVDNNNNLLPLGSVDPHYTLISSADPNSPGPNVYVGIVPGFWMANGPNSAWIAPVPQTGEICEPGGIYVYQTTFDLFQYDPATVSITGHWSADDAGVDIKLNGNSTGITATNANQDSGWVSFTITNGFVSGLNTLDFIVHNLGDQLGAGWGGCDPTNMSDPNNPTGLRVELSGNGVLNDLNQGLVAYYPLRGNANDVSGNGNNGTAYNVNWVPDRFGNPNGAVEFEGNTDSYINVPPSQSLYFPSQFSISLWCYVEGYEGRLFCIDDVDEPSDNVLPHTYQLECNSIETYYQNPYLALWSTPLPLNQWFNLVGVSTRTSTSLYVNGQLVASASGPNAGDFAQTLAFNIGRMAHAGYDPFQGRMDEVRVYNRALSSTEIQQLYQLSAYGVPTITSVNVGPAGNGNLTMSIQGSGFGTSAPFNGICSFLKVVDLTQDWEAGFTGDGVNVNVSAWADTNIVITGFTGWLFNTPSYKFHEGDQLEVMVENPQTQSGFVTNTVTLNQGALIIDIQPPQTNGELSVGHPMMINNVELADFENALLTQLQQPATTPIAIYVMKNPPNLVSDVELDLLCIGMDAPYSILDGASEVSEVGFSWAVGGIAVDILGNEAANAILPTTSPVDIAIDSTKAVFGWTEASQANLFNQYGGCWQFIGGNSVSEGPGFCALGTVECGEHIRLEIPLSSLPASSVDLRNVLGNLRYGVVEQVCGGYPTIGACSSANFGPVLEQSYSEGDIGFGLPTFQAKVIDVLGNQVSTPLLPTGAFFSITTSNSPPNGGTNSGSGVAYSNSIVTVTATPNLGFSFSSWSENGFAVSLLTNYTFTATSNQTLAANFITNFYSITTTSLPPGAGTTAGDTNAAFGTSVTVTANSTNVSYGFGGWMDDNSNVVSKSSSYTFTVNSDSNLVANFVPLGSSLITAVASPPSAGSVTGGGTYINGQNATLTAAPSSCYSFVDWTTNGATFSSSLTNTFTVETNLIVTANFAPISYNIAVGASAGGTANGGGPYDCGTGVTVHAAPNPCYSFVNWTENGIPVSGLADFFFVVDTNHNFVANFAPVTNNIATSSSPAKGGTTSGGGAAGCDASVTVTAMPNSGYSFVNWTVGANVVSTLSNYTFTASGNQSLVANFAPNVPFLGFASPPLYAGNVGLTLQGPVGSNYEVDASTDLFNWLPSTNFILTGSPLYFSVPVQTNSSQGFYRAVMP